MTISYRNKLLHCATKTFSDYYLIFCLFAFLSNLIEWSLKNCLQRSINHVKAVTKENIDYFNSFPSITFDARCKLEVLIIEID